MAGTRSNGWMGGGEIDRWENEGGRRTDGLRPAGMGRWWRMLDGVTAVLVALALWLVIAGLASGCAQNSEQPVRQSTGQATVTPTQNRQDADTQGTYIRFDIAQAPGGKATVNYPATQPSDEGMAVDNLHSDAVATSVGRGRMGYLQINNFSVTTGGTAPSLTGSATGSGSATQSPNATASQTPTQDVKPRVGVTANAAVQGTGIANQQGSGTAGEGATTSDQSNANDQRIAKIDERLGKLESLGATLEKFLAAQKPPASQPASMTAETH